MGSHRTHPKTLKDSKTNPSNHLRTSTRLPRSALRSSTNSQNFELDSMCVFRGKLSTDSGRRCRPIPEEVVQGFRCDVVQFFCWRNRWSSRGMSGHAGIFLSEACVSIILARPSRLSIPIAANSTRPRSWSPNYLRLRLARLEKPWTRTIIRPQLLHQPVESQS